MRNKIFLAGLLALVALGTAACSKAPEQAIQAGSAAMDAAKAAGAEVYAADALQAAQGLLDQANAEKQTQDEKFVLFRSYKDSEGMYNQATAGFEAAAQAAATAKEQARVDGAAAIEGAKGAIAAAREALSGAPRTKDSKADLDLWANDLTTYDATVVEAEAAMAAEDYIGAKAQADSVAAKAGEISASIQAAIEKVQSRRR